jgi:hypothetical protein
MPPPSSKPGTPGANRGSVMKKMDFEVVSPLPINLLVDVDHDFN